MRWNLFADPRLHLVVLAIVVSIFWSNPRAGEVADGVERRAHSALDLVTKEAGTLLGVAPPRHRGAAGVDLATRGHMRFDAAYDEESRRGD